MELAGLRDRAAAAPRRSGSSRAWKWPAFSVPRRRSRSTRISSFGRVGGTRSRVSRCSNGDGWSKRAARSARVTAAIPMAATTIA